MVQDRIYFAKENKIWLCAYQLQVSLKATAVDSIIPKQCKRNAQNEHAKWILQYVFLD